MKNELNTAMILAGENLLNALNPERNYMPYWCMDIRDDYSAKFKEDWPQHNLGRWWDAILRLEDATGFTIPARVEAAMLQNLERFFNNPDNLCLQPPDYDGTPFPLEFHSLRESLLALHALVKFRGSRWAAQKGHQMLETVDKIYSEDGMIDFSKLDSVKYYTEKLKRHFDPVGSSGRFLEALVWYYQATNDELAMNLARRIAEYNLEYSTMEDGSINHASRPNHTHSYFNMLQGLLLYSRETGNRKYIERVARVYEKSARKLVKESGFTAHNLEADDGGETSSGGDATLLAMWLVDEGYLNFSDDAERIIRARTLPSQIIETQELKPMGNDGRDCFRDLSRRCIGGFSCHNLPHAGKINTTDVTAHCLHALIDAYKHIVVHRGSNTFVMLHFDYQDDTIEIKSERDVKARLTIQLIKPTPLFVRIPRWTDAASVAAEVNGHPIPLIMHECFAYIGIQPVNSVVCIKYALPEKVIYETTTGVEYKIAWKGDDVIGISPNIGIFPFYKTLA
jgi:hypothetical protein